VAFFGPQHMYVVICISGNKHSTYTKTMLNICPPQMIVTAEFLQQHICKVYNSYTNRTKMLLNKVQLTVHVTINK